jgi:hypothetical protein
MVQSREDLIVCSNTNLVADSQVWTEGCSHYRCPKMSEKRPSSALAYIVLRIPNYVIIALVATRQQRKPGVVRNVHNPSVAGASTRRPSWLRMKLCTKPQAFLHQRDGRRISRVI